MLEYTNKGCHAFSNLKNAVDGGGQGGEKKGGKKEESREDFQAWFSLSTSSELVNREGGAEKSSHGG